MSERDIFIAALQLEDAARRQVYLDGACAGQPQLRRQVEELLRLYEGAGSFLGGPAAGSGATTVFAEASEHAPGASPGAVIGRYKLLQQIGEGGMGAVWMAQQTEPVKRLVALKLIKVGMDSRQVLARFEAERQALALMDHPNIAKVHDAGQTESGRPYFVMELVKGMPITRYCDEHHLTPRQRLELFVPVCEAIQHAHQKGVIHRDIKPSNVLVALYDGKPVPKVIDFGVAKATGQSLTDRTLLTGLGTVVGTLEYMSPEQAEVNQLDVDTRSDVYSLGVLLYELLAGSPPFSRKELEKAGMLEMLRVIREQEPPRPSAKLSTAEGLPSLAANRGTEPAKLTKLVRGELDWIVMKALEKDRNRRYDTANGFAADVQRYLADEAVQACPPSSWYRLRKLLRRHKGPALAVSLVLLTLVGGIIGTTWGMVQATDAATEMDRARTQAVGDRNWAQAAEKQAKDDRDDAIAQKKRAVHQQYVMGMFPVSRLWREGSHVQVRRLLDLRRPDPDEKEDQRGFEWHYQDRLCWGPLRTLKGHYTEGLYETAQAIAFSPDGRWLASGGAGGGKFNARGELVLWDMSTGQEVRRFHDDDHEAQGNRVAFSPDGKTLASAGNGAVQLWDVGSGRLLHSLGSGVQRVESLAFSPDGRHLVSAGNHERDRARPGAGQSPATVEVWEVAGGKLLGSWDTELLSLAAFHPEGHVLTVTSTAVTLHDPATGKPSQSFAHGQEVKPPFNTETQRPNLFAAVSPNGSRLALSADDGVWLWDLIRGTRCYPLLIGHTRKETNGLMFSPDGQRLASAGNNGSVVVWALTASPSQPSHYAPERSTIQVLEAGVVCTAFSPDGLRLAVAGADGLLRIYDAANNGQETRVFRRLNGERVAFTRDGGKFLVLRGNAEGAGMPSLHDAVSGHKLPGPVGGQGPVAYSPDGRWLASGCKEGVRLWDAETCRPVRTLRTSMPHSLTFLADGRLASITGGRVQIWDAASGRELFLFEADGRVFGRVAITPDGRRLAASTSVRIQPGQPNVRPEPPQLDVWDLEQWRTGEENAPLLTIHPHSKTLTDVAYSPDGKWLATTGQDQGRALNLACGSHVNTGRLAQDQFWGQFWAVKLWDAATGKEVRSIPWPRERFSPGSVDAVAFSPDGRLLAAAGSGLVKVWDLSGCQEVFTHKWDMRAGSADTLAFSPDGRALVVGFPGGHGKVLNLDTRRERLVLTGSHSFGRSGVAFSPDGRRLAMCCHELRVWDPVSGAELHCPGGHVFGVVSMAVSPVGGRLATGGKDQMVRVWELDGWKPLWTFQGHASPVAALAFSPDGRLLASGDGAHSFDSETRQAIPGDVRIWALTDQRPGVTPTPKHHLKGHPEKIVALAFSPDGQRLVSVGAQGSLKVWDVASGQELSSAKLAKDKLSGVAFSPDGRLVVCGGEDGTVLLWDIARGQEVRALTVDDRQRRGRNMSTIHAVTFSADGRRLAAAGVGVVRIWDRLTLEEVYTVSPAGAGGDLAFSPDGSFLIGVGNLAIGQTGDKHGSSELWSMQVGIQDTTVLWDGRPLTPEREVEREALALLDQLFNRPLPRRDVLDRLRADPALSEPVRQAALRLADHYREEESPKRYADAARLLAHSPGLPPAYHTQALGQAEAACALAPTDGYCLTALGMAQYRLGKSQEALQTLIRADERNTRMLNGDGDSVPVDLALLALVHHRLGNKDEAEKFVRRVQDRMRNVRWKGNEEAEVLRREAELRIHGTLPLWPAGATQPTPAEKPKP